MKVPGQRTSDPSDDKSELFYFRRTISAGWWIGWLNIPDVVRTGQTGGGGEGEGHPCFDGFRRKRGQTVISPLHDTLKAPPEARSAPPSIVV